MPAMHHPCHRLRSQCWGLGFKPQAAARTCFQRRLRGWVGVRRGGDLWRLPLCQAQDGPYQRPTAAPLRSTHPPSSWPHGPASPPAPPPPRLSGPRLLPLTLAQQLQAPPLLAHLQAQHLLQHLLPLRLLCQPHPLQFLPIQPQQRPAWERGEEGRSQGQHARSIKSQGRVGGEEGDTDSKRKRGRDREIRGGKRGIGRGKARTDRAGAEKSQKKVEMRWGGNGRFCKETNLEGEVD